MEMTRYQIAKRVREKCEVFSERTRLFGRSLQGMCAIASAALAYELTRAGYSAKVIYGSKRGCEHCWVVSDKRIYDITATQFGLKNKVYITRTTNRTYPKRLIKSYDAKLRSFTNWPAEQRPIKMVIARVLSRPNRKGRRAK